MSERIDCESCVCNPDKPGCTAPRDESCGANVTTLCGRVAVCDLPAGHQPAGTHQESGGITWGRGGVW